MRRLLTVVYTAALLWCQVAWATQAIPTPVMPPSPTTAPPTPVPTGPTPTPGTVGDPPTPHPTSIPTACTECTLTPTPTTSPSATPGPTGTPTVAPSPTTHPCCLGIPGYILVPIVPGTQRGKMTGDLGPDICIQWRYDPNHPEYFSPDLGISPVYDEDFCVHYSQPVWQMEPQPFAVGPSGFNVVWAGIPGIASQDTRTFSARFPLPVEIGGSDIYTLNRTVSDSGNCNAVDAPVTDSKEITVCRPIAQWDCDHEWVEKVLASGTGGGRVGAKFTNQHIFSFSSICGDPSQLVGRWGSEEVDYEAVDTILVGGETIYIHREPSATGYITGANLKDITILAHQPSQSFLHVSWPTSCHVDAGQMDIYTDLCVIDEDKLREEASRFPNSVLRHHHEATSYQALYIDGAGVVGSGVKCQDKKKSVVTIDFYTEYHPTDPIVPSGITAQLITEP